MGNLAMSGIPPEKMTELGLDFSRFPPWIMLWVGLYIDVFCNVMQCRSTWRDYLPFGLGDKGAWLSEEFSCDDILDDLVMKSLTFEQFQAAKGFEVTAGSSLFAGYQDFSQWSKSAYEFMFQTSSTAFSRLSCPTALCTVAFLVLCLKIAKAATMTRFQSFGRKVARQTHGDAWLEENEERIVKFGEYVFRLFFHSFISLAGFYCFWSAPWWEKGGTMSLYTDFPNDPVSPAMTWYYLFQAGYNADAMISLLQISLQINFFPKHSSFPISIGWSDTVRGDFNEMLAHHVVTNALVFLSSTMGQTRIGSMVFWIHDISDVPVDLCKLANFVKSKIATVVMFLLLLVSWWQCRLVVLPFTIWRSVYLESWECIRAFEKMDLYYFTFQPAFLFLLGILILLHFVWFSMFMKMLYILATKGETHDMSEHKQGEKQDVPYRNAVTANGNGKKTN
jgi:TLC domain